MKRQKKAEKEKKDEKELWARLKILDKEFKNINKSKKKANEFYFFTDWKIPHKKLKQKS